MDQNKGQHNQEAESNRREMSEEDKQLEFICAHWRDIGAESRENLYYRMWRKLVPKKQWYETE